MWKIQQNDLIFFEVKKNIRFLLEPLFEPSTSFEETVHIQHNLSIFIKKYKIVLKSLHSLLFNQKMQILNNKLKIKFCFLRKNTTAPYFENEIYKFKNKHKNQIELYRKELHFLVEIFNSFLWENTNYVEKLQLLLSKNSTQNPDIKYYFHKISRKTNFEFLWDLCESINTQIPTLHFQLVEIKKIIKELYFLKEKLQNEFHQEQSFWKVVETANLNYFLVHKKSKNYDELLTNKEKSLHHHISNFPKFSKATQENGLKDFENYYSLLYSQSELTETHELLKEYKNIQKEWFLQFINNWYSFTDLKNHKNFSFYNHHLNGIDFPLIIYLFDDISEKNFYILQEISHKIQQLISIKNSHENIEKKRELYRNICPDEIIPEENIESIRNILNKKIIQFQKERGKFFNTETYACISKKYAHFCAEYKKISLEIGKIQAQMKHIKDEQIQVERIQSWAIILEKENQKFLLTIPKEKINAPYFHKENNIHQARNFIQTLKNTKNDYTLYHFESLTLKILEKLCFHKESSYFRNKIAKELYEFNQNFVEKKDFFQLRKTIETYNIKMKYELPKNISWETCKQTLLHFYKSVLQLKSLQEEIIIHNHHDFHKFIDKDFKNLEEFEKELKEICYIKENISISNEVKEILIEKFQAHLYKITSYDLEKCLKRENKKSHTKIWLNFWDKINNTQKYPIRINPEIKISFIKKEKNILLSSWKEKVNRKIKNRYLLTTNITEHACKNSWFVNGKTKKEIINFYEKFNKEFEYKINEKIFSYTYFIDIWENNSIKLSLYKNNTLIEIPTYQLHSEYFLEINNKWTPLYKNFSYFQYDNHKDFYKIEKNPYIDVSQAKLINEKIYLEWDISTYLNLKLKSAKKKISHFYSKYSHIQISEFNQNYIVLIWWNTQELVIYEFEEKYEIIQSRWTILKELQDFLQSKDIDSYQEEDISIHDIENLKNALCANIIWIIFFLQKEYPGRIIVRNFHQNRNNLSIENLDKKIEEKILQKLSSLSLIPSNYKYIFELKEQNILNKLWLIEFVN